MTKLGLTGQDCTEQDAERAGIKPAALRRIDKATITKAGRALADRIEAPNEATACRLPELCSLIVRAGVKAFTLAEAGCNVPPLMNYYDQQAWRYPADDPRRAECRTKANAAGAKWEIDHAKREAANDARLSELVGILAALTHEPWCWAQESLGATIYRSDATSKAPLYRDTSTVHVNGSSIPALWISGR
jgi:hypothetical protein